MLDREDFTLIVEVMGEIDRIKREKKQTEGTMPCPKCGGTLRWMAHSPRAMRMWCETEGCIKAMS